MGVLIDNKKKNWIELLVEAGTEQFSCSIFGIFYSPIKDVARDIRDKSFQEILDHMNVFMPCLDFTELSPVQKLQFLIGDTFFQISLI